jgi:hypothetical protein
VKENSMNLNSQRSRVRSELHFLMMSRASGLPVLTFDRLSPVIEHTIKATRDNPDDPEMKKQFLARLSSSLAAPLPRPLLLS